MESRSTGSIEERVLPFHPENLAHKLQYVPVLLRRKSQVDEGTRVAKRLLDLRTA
jgi:hypothetical protein